MSLSGSNGKLYRCPLLETTSFPGTLISTVSCISPNYAVAMVQLDENNICMYGANVAEEGAILVIYNLRFKLTQAVQNLKLYTGSAKLWKVEDKLLLAANDHLALVSFRLSTEKLVSMIGCCADADNDADNDVIVQENIIMNWTNKEEADEEFLSIPFSELPPKIANKIKHEVEVGTCDLDILENLFPQLIKSKDVSSILWCLQHFQETFPEKLLVDLVLFSLRTPDKVFRPKQNGVADNGTTKSVLSRNDFLDRVLAIPFTDMYLLYNLKSFMNFDNAWALMEYLIKKLDVSEENSGEGPTENLIRWGEALMDSHYQHYLLTQDPNIAILLKKLENSLESHVS